jgi:hypothetical protein
MGSSREPKCSEVAGAEQGRNQQAAYPTEEDAQPLPHSSTNEAAAAEATKAGRRRRPPYSR